MEHEAQQSEEVDQTESTKELDRSESLPKTESAVRGAADCLLESSLADALKWLLARDQNLTLLANAFIRSRPSSDMSVGFREALGNSEDVRRQRANIQRALKASRAAIEPGTVCGSTRVPASGRVTRCAEITNTPVAVAEIRKSLGLSGDTSVVRQESTDQLLWHCVTGNGWRTIVDKGFIDPYRSRRPVCGRAG
jgi:hypothetical protein